MRRILFHWLGHPVYAYPAMLYIGIVLGIYAQLGVAASLGLDTSRVLAATIALIAVALFGARLLHAVPHWRHYLHHPHEIFAFSKGGASMYGGLLLGVPASVPVLAALDLPFGLYWDACTFTMLVGMVVTRIGCFLNGCCAGRATCGHFGFHLPDYRGVWQRRIPTQALEAGWGVITIAAAALALSHRLFPGAVFLLALGVYGLGRLMIEPLRDRPDRVAGFALHRLLSILFIAIALCGFTAGLLWRTAF
jgi:phosphatidylglycerol:prolipoprotein diacylglycerol transferase